MDAVLPVTCAWGARGVKAIYAYGDVDRDALPHLGPDVGHQWGQGPVPALVRRHLGGSPDTHIQSSPWDKRALGNSGTISHTLPGSTLRSSSERTWLSRWLNSVSINREGHCRDWMKITQNTVPCLNKVDQDHSVILKIRWFLYSGFDEEHISKLVSITLWIAYAPYFKTEVSLVFIITMWHFHYLTSRPLWLNDLFWWCRFQL